MNLKSTSIDKYDFAFSFAGEDRKIVEKIKKELVKENYSVFYDNDFNYELVGKDLYTYLRSIYKDKCRYVVCFISDNYSKKIWTNLEMSAIKERLMSTFFASDFLIPILLKDPEIIKDIPSFIGFYKHKTIRETANLLIKKINSALVEDNYLYNIDNCIEYIYENVYKTLLFKRYWVKKTNCKIVLKFNNNQFAFRITSEQQFNLPCLLIYFENIDAPDLLISWKRSTILNFEIVYFFNLNESEKNVSIKGLINRISDYMIERVEGYHEHI